MVYLSKFHEEEPVLGSCIANPLFPDGGCGFGVRLVLELLELARYSELIKEPGNGYA
jgi:hypothetical protein